MLRVQSDASTTATTTADSLRSARVFVSPPARESSQSAETSSTATNAAVAKQAERAPTADELSRAVSQINEAIKLRDSRIQFEIESDISTVVTKIVDGSTGEVLRQIPSEEVLRIARALATDKSDSVSLVTAKA